METPDQVYYQVYSVLEANKQVLCKCHDATTATIHYTMYRLYCHTTMPWWYDASALLLYMAPSIILHTYDNTTFQNNSLQTIYIFILVYIETFTRLPGISTVISIGVRCGTSDEATNGTCRRYPTTPWDAPQVATGPMQCSLGSCGVSRWPYVGPIGCSRLIGCSVGVWVFYRLDIVWALRPQPKCNTKYFFFVSAIIPQF